ncbi:MAG: hypothetical protein GX593_05645 [Actinomycetales bacterium]|nr:hypothetical protein [Actinomycetales bacterium]
MSTLVRRVSPWVVAAGLVAALAGCSSGGDLEISNLGPGEVTVDVDGSPSTVHPDGGMLVLGIGCTEGDVTVRHADGSVTVVPGPICSEQRLVIHDGEVEVKPARQQGS